LLSLWWQYTPSSDILRSITTRSISETTMQIIETTLDWSVIDQYGGANN